MRKRGVSKVRAGLTWEALVAAEPRLSSLLEEIRASRSYGADEFELVFPAISNARNSGPLLC
jgi:hypothetical protein